VDAASRRDTPDEVRVLHVDDDPDFLDVAAAFLERELDDVEVVGATSAAAGLDRLAESRFDCIVSDYDMPGLDGLAFLERVREADTDIPFILFTGKGSEDVAGDAISAGVTDYLRKASGTNQYAVLANRIENAVERYRSRRALEASEERLSLFIDQSPLGVIEWSESFDVVPLNDAAERILGYEEADLRGRSWEAIFPESDSDAVGDVVSALLENEGGYHIVNENVRADGERIVCEWHNRVITDDDGDVVAIFSQFQDVTDREERQRRLTALHEATRELMGARSRDAVADIAVVTTRDTLGMPINSVYLYDEATNALEPAAVTAEARDIIGDPPTYEPGDSLSWDAFESGEVRVFEDVSTEPGRYAADTDFGAEIILPLGDHGVMHVASTEAGAFDDGDVALARTLAANTEEALSRIERERSLRESQRRYRTLVDNFPEGGVFLFDEDLRYTLAGGAEIEQVAMDPESFVGRTLHDVFPTDVAEVQEPHYRAALDGETREFEQRYDGNWYRVQTVPLDLPDARRGMAVTQNITDSKEYVRRLETLISNLPGMVYRSRNERGWPMDEVRGDIEALTGYTAADLESGDVVWGEDVIHPEERDRLWEAVQTALDRDDSFEVTYRIVAKDGSTRWMWERGRPVHDHADGTVTLEGFITDITDRKEYEHELERRNERLDEFARVVSHDLRNPLNVIEGSLDLLADTVESDHLDRARRAVERMEHLIEDLLTLARQGETITDPAPVALTALVGRCWENVETTAATLDVRTSAVVSADESRLTQLFENLIRNAVEHGSTSSRTGSDDAVEHGSGDGSVTVTVGDLDDRSGFYVADDGVGIPESERDSVFESGHSTDGSSTGFGLAIVQDIAEAHGWRVTLTESDAGGARFEFTGVEYAD
jgi:PAS domain S-box-containing protein